MDVRAVDEAATADAAAVGEGHVGVVGARAAWLPALAPDAALGQLGDHVKRLRRHALDRMEGQAPSRPGGDFIDR